MSQISIANSKYVAPSKIWFFDISTPWDIGIIVEGSLDKGHSINLSVCHIYVILTSLFITPHLVYVTSDTNPADPISCGELGDAGMHISASALVQPA